MIRLGIILLLTADYSCFAYGKKEKISSDPLQLVHWRVGGRGHSLGLMWNRQSIARQIVPWGHTFLAAAQNRRLLLTQLMCTWFELDGKITRLGNKSLSKLPPRFGRSAPALSCQRRMHRGRCHGREPCKLHGGRSPIEAIGLTHWGTTSFIASLLSIITLG